MLFSCKESAVKMFLYNKFSVISKPRFELIFSVGVGKGQGKEINKIRGLLLLTMTVV